MTDPDKTLALMVTSGADEGKVFVLVEGFLGTGTASAYDLTDASVADMHARITLRRGVWHITDLTTAPDIRVNNSVVKSRRIQHGDVIRIGSTEMQVVAVEDAPDSPSNIESKPKAPTTEDKPASQTMQISVNADAEGWTPGKPKPKPAPKVSKELKTEHRAAGAHPVREIRTAGASSYSRRRPAPQPADTGGSKAMLYTLLIAIILLPLVIGGIMVGNKRSATRALSQALNEAQSFESRHPDRQAEIIEMYRRVEMMATGSNEHTAQLARERIRKLESDSVNQNEALANALEALDSRAGQLADEGRPEEAANVYEEYQGGLREEILSARAQRIRSLRSLPTATPTPAVTTPEPEPVASATPSRTPPPPPSADLKTAEMKVQKIAAAAVDHMIAEDVAAAIEEIERITGDAALSGYTRAAEDALISLKLLQTIDRTAKLDPDKDPANDQDQRPFVRVIYSLRKNDVFAARFLVSDLKGSLLYDELAKRSKMSKEEIARETAVMSEFLKLWSKFTKASVRKIPRPEECVEQLEQVIDSRDEKSVKDFCDSMTKLQKDNATSKFIERYESLFTACQPQSLAAVAESSQVSGIGNAKVVRAGMRKITFEATRTIPDPKDGRVGIFSEKEVFFDPDDDTVVAADIELHTIAEYEKLNDRQGTFELPAAYERPKPVKGDRIFVRSGIKTGSKFVPLIRQQASEAIYTEDFVWKRHGSRWHSHGVNLHMDGRIKISPASDTGRPAGRPNAWFDITLTKPTVIDMVITRENEAPLTIIIGDAQFVLAGSGSRPTGVWNAGHRVNDRKLKSLPLKMPIPVKATWTPLTTSLQIGSEVLSAATDTARNRPAPRLIGFLSRGSFVINKFQISSASGKSNGSVVGVNKAKSAVLVPRGDSEEWKAVKEGDDVFIMNKGSGQRWASTPAKVTRSEEKYLVCALSARAPISSSTAASLTGSSSSAASALASPFALSSSRWAPEVFFGKAKTSASGDIAVSPDVPCSYSQQGFISKAIKTLWQPHTEEALMAYPVEPRVGLFSEAGGILKCKVQTANGQGGTMGQNVIVSRLAPPVGTPSLLSPASFIIPASASAHSQHSWHPAQGSWQVKLGRVLSPTVTGGVAVASVPQAIHENCQYTVNARIEAAAQNDNMPELIVEVYSPFWKKTLSLVTGTRGSTIEFDKIRHTGKAFAINRDAYTPYNERSPKWDKAFKSNRPKLKTNQAYNIQVRRVDGSFAYYINGKRIATVNYPGMAGDLRLRVACGGGQISLGTSSATILPRSVKLPTAEAPAGDFGYIIAVDGTRLYVDADGNGLTQGARLSVMKMVPGEGGDVVLKRVAVGTVSQAGSRVAKCVLTAATEPPEPGMKVMAGLQPEELSLTAARLASLDDGL